jgi:hypothetical protein
MDYEGPEGELRYNSTLYLTSAVDGMGSQRHALVAVAPGNRPVSHYTEGWCVPGPKRMGFDSCTFHPVASRYSDHFIPVHINQKRLDLLVKYT